MTQHDKDCTQEQANHLQEMRESKLTLFNYSEPEIFREILVNNVMIDLKLYSKDFDNKDELQYSIFYN